MNPDFSSYYNNTSGEAGKYKGGECPQCHEPHASFGESEPPPSTGGDAGADPYLLMKEYGTSTNYANLCWFCHENMFNINGSGSPIGMGRWSFYQGQTVYQASSHYQSPNFYWPGTTADPVTIWPRQSRSSQPSGNNGSCLNCHTPHGIKSAGSSTAFDSTSPDGSGGVPAARQTVASGNLSVNADYLIPRQLIAWEETLCERCHDASGPATKNIQTEINKRLVANQSGHPVDDTSLAGRHIASEPLPITTKHVECYDCHNPHAVKAGTNVPGDGQAGRITGMKYIDINGTVKNPAAGDRQPYVYEVCFKCHGNSFDCIMPYKALGASDGTAGCAPLTTRNRGIENGAGFNAQMGASNKRKEFDPTTIIGTTHGADATKTNGGFHPVASPGRNHSIQLCNQLKTAFNLSCANQATATTELSTLTINCTDCHNNDAVGGDTVRGPITESSLRWTDKPSVYVGSLPTGPHGSTNKRLLRSNYPTLIGSGNCGGWGGWGGGGGPVIADRICFRCHHEGPFIDDDYLGVGEQWTNFWGSGGWGGGGGWGGSLHNYHLSQGTSDSIPIQCHECHNNVHSNVEANNTQYYSGAACCTGFPADGNTHLLNFAPNVTADQYAKPAWYNTGGLYACNLRCHGKTMTSCRYRGTYDGPAGGGGWC